MRLNVIELAVLVTSLGFIGFIIIRMISDAAHKSELEATRRREEEKTRSEKLERIEEGRLNAQTITPSLCSNVIMGIGLTTLQRRNAYDEQCRDKWVLWAATVIDVDIHSIVLCVRNGNYKHTLDVNLGENARSDPSTLALIKKLRLGQAVMVCGKISGTYRAEAAMEFSTSLHGCWLIESEN